jgi:hypothetical protein
MPISAGFSKNLGRNSAGSLEQRFQTKTSAPDGPVRRLEGLSGQNPKESSHLLGVRLPDQA